MALTREEKIKQCAFSELRTQIVLKFFTYKDIARKLGRAELTVNSWMAGRCVWPMADAYKVLEILDIKAGDFVTYFPPKRIARIAEGGGGWHA